MKFNGLENHFKTNEHGEIEDFTQMIHNNLTPLMYALCSNQSEHLNLNSRQFDYLIQNSDLKQVDYFNSSNSLMYALEYHKYQNLNLTNKQWDCLIINSDLKQLTKFGFNSLMFALEYHKYQNLNLTNKQWKYLIEHSDVSLIKEKNMLLELKKIKSKLLNDEIVSQIEMNEKNNISNKKVKI